MENISMFNGKFVLALIVVGILVAFLANGFQHAQPAINQHGGVVVEKVLDGSAGKAIFNR